MYLWNSREVKIVVASPEKLLTPTLAGYLSNDHFSIKWTFIKREFRGIAKGKSNLNGFHRDDAQENWVIKQGLFINRVLLWRYIYFVYENKKKITFLLRCLSCKMQILTLLSNAHSSDPAISIAYVKKLSLSLTKRLSGFEISNHATLI